MADRDQEGAQFAMTDLSEALRAEGGTQLRTEITSRFSELEAEIDASLAHGLSPADYAGAVKLLAAIIAAREIVVQFR